MNDIADGKYVGRVVDAVITTSKAGNPMVVLEWDVDGRLRRKSYHTMEKKGVRDERSIRVLRALFTEWDGVTADWFVENYDKVLKTAAKLDIIHQEYNGMMFPSIKCVNPLPKGFAGASAVPPPPKRPVAEEPTKVGGTLPEVIEPTLESVWNAYVTVHADEDYPTLETGWFALLDKMVVPQKDQDKYDAFDWQTVIAALREQAAPVEKEVL